MSKLLYIQSSPRSGRSKSISVADAFVEEYRRLRPSDAIDTLNVFTTELPAFDGPVVQAKYNLLHGRPHSAGDQQAWKAVEAVIDRFKAADRYLLAIPMWNFGIPYRFKHYLDLIMQPGYTFGFSAEKGYYGLVIGKPLVVVYARGGEYPAGSPLAAYDMQKPYVELAFRFMGFTDIRSIVLEPTLQGSPEEIEARKKALVPEARRLATAISV
ncbi:MAG: FMN-dependent NADH-azoreductase [Phycisphaerae bacterium]|nr:FMN-dependent NADH-azoreductase [Phycisphaerae bacterium]